MEANLFKNGCYACLSEEAQEELKCLGVSVKETNCTIETVAPYPQDLESLLQSYPVFSLGLPLNEDGLLFNFQDRAIFIENDGYQVSLRQSKFGIFTYAKAADPDSWEVLTRFRIAKKYELYSLYDLLTNYPLFYDNRFMKRWGEIDISWGDLDGKWSGFKIKKEYIFREGDTFLTLSPCEETMCLYIVIEDVAEEDYTKFSVNDGRWVKISCITTGFNKCMGNQRKKHPTDLYKLVRLGSRGDCVEVPIRYRPSPPLYEGTV